MLVERKFLSSEKLRLKQFKSYYGRVETKLNSLGLKIPQPLKVPPNVKTPSAWIRLRGNKHTFQAMDLRTQMVLLLDLLVR